MNKTLLSGSLILLFILYGLHQHQEENTALTVAPAATALPVAPVVTALPGQTATQTTTQVTTATSTSTPSPTSIPSQAGKYKDGAYTGTVTDAYWGNVQVQATISGSKIVSVQFLQYPNDRSTSKQINTRAIPTLQQEAIQAQSAEVDGVSGASDTSQAFKESLSAALVKAS